MAENIERAINRLTQQQEVLAKLLRQQNDLLKKLASASAPTSKPKGDAGGETK